MKNENPCENCIVRAICTISCDELDNFATESIDLEELIPPSATRHDVWVEKYECRPRIKERVKRLSLVGLKSQSVVGSVDTKPYEIKEK